MPTALPPGATDALARQGFGSITHVQSLTGGVISQVYRLATRTGASLVLKHVRNAPPLLYSSEAEGLRALAGIPGIRVPQVLALGTDWILLEDLGPQPPSLELLHAGDRYWETFGRGLAHLHGRLGSRCGWERDTCWGMSVLDQCWCPDGHSFYVHQRFLWYHQRPAVRARLRPVQLDQLERIAQRLPDLIPVQHACLLHGDLWHGNRIIAADGSPAVIDPCIHYGWAEADLANCLMFGGFPERFYDAYCESHPLDPGWRSRNRVLWILHLLSALDHAQDWAQGWVGTLLEHFGS